MTFGTHQSKLKYQFYTHFNNHAYTLGAFCDLSFRTSSPCCATRSYKTDEAEEEEEEEEEEEREEEEAVAADGGAVEAVAEIIPGL